MCDCAQGCTANPVTRSYLFTPTQDLRRRTGYSGIWGTHVSGSVVGEASFVTSLDNLVNFIAMLVGNTLGLSVDWIGHGGLGGFCDNNSYHSTGRAFDLTAVGLSNGFVIDMNGSWQSTTQHQKRYTAILAACRSHYGTGGVISAGYNSDHANHIHSDDWHGWTPFSKSGGADRVILRRCFKTLLGWSSPAVNTAAWTGADDNGMTWLLAGLGMSCKDPFTNVWDAVGMLDLIGKYGMSGLPFGSFAAPC